MLTFKSFIAEGFVNVILSKQDEDRKKYAKQVWDLLQSSYAKIGGIKGQGFSSVDDMIANIPFWKLFQRLGLRWINRRLWLRWSRNKHQSPVK